MYSVDVCLVTLLLGMRRMLGHKVAVMFLYDSSSILSTRVLERG